MSTAPDAILERLQALQRDQSLAIIKLRESLASEDAATAQKRNSDVSADAIQDVTPASLEAELAHYKELFSKLRLSYVEQVTREKFLRAIVGNPPLFVEQQDNVQLEAQLVEVKANLKAQKLETAELVAELDRRARELSNRYETVQSQTIQLQSLPDQIKDLEATSASLKATLEPPSTNPSLSLPLPETIALLNSRESELASLNAQLASLQSVHARKSRELDRLEGELRPLEAQKMATVAAAKDARRRKEDGIGGMNDELDDNGRWLSAAELGLRRMLDVEG